MTIPIQNAESSQALAASLGLKGKVSLEIDTVVVPVEVTGDLPDTPYSPIVPIGGGAAQGPAGVGVEGAITIQPGRGGILVIKRITVPNTTGSPGAFELRLMTPANFVTGTIVSQANAFNYNSLFIAGGVARNGAIVSVFTHTVVLGQDLERLNVLDGDTGVIKLPGGYALYGDDPSGPVGLGLWNTVANEPVSATFHGKFYLNKG